MEFLSYIAGATLSFVGLFLGWAMGRATNKKDSNG